MVEDYETFIMPVFGFLKIVFEYVSDSKYPIKKWNAKLNYPKFKGDINIVFWYKYKCKYVRPNQCNQPSPPPKKKTNPKDINNHMDTM